MSPGALAPRRTDDADGREAHRKSDQCAANKGIIDSLLQRRPRVLQQDGEDASGEHKYAEARGLHHVFRPMAAKRDQAVGLIHAIPDWCDYLHVQFLRSLNVNGTVEYSRTLECFMYGPKSESR